MTSPSLHPAALPDSNTPSPPDGSRQAPSESSEDEPGAEPRARVHQLGSRRLSPNARGLTGKLRHDLRSAWQFVRAGIRDFDTTASLIPSSRFLVRSMLEDVPLENATCVVELGPGVGTITEAILERLPPHAHLHAIELNGPLLEVMAKSLPDPRLRPIHGDATRMAELLHACGCEKTNVVFSSLGLSMMPDDVREAVAKGVVDVLLPGAPFVQYTYLHAWMGFWSRQRGWTRFDGWRYFDRHYHDVRSRVVVANVPPAAVFTCRRPRVTELPAKRRTREQRRRAAHG